MDAPQLLRQLRDLVDSGRSERLAPAVQQLFDQVDGDLDSLEDSLLRLQEYVVLTNVTADDMDMLGAQAAWQEAPSDQQHREIRALVSASPTLAAMHRAGVSIDSVFKYSEDRLEVANVLGGAAVTQAASYIRFLQPPTAAKDRRTFAVSPRALDDVRRLVEDLERRGVLEGYSIQGKYAGRDGEDRWRNPASAGPRVPKNGRVWYGEVPEPVQSFLRGHWLTAFAYSVAHDQFTRAEAPFEVYSNVMYHLPRDMGGGSSDIDVLVRTTDQVLFIECKSGSVLAEHGGRRALDKVVSNAHKLDRVLSAMGVGLQRTYLLLHLGRDDSDSIRAEIAKEPLPLEVLEPAQLRGRVMQLAGGTQA